MQIRYTVSPKDPEIRRNEIAIRAEEARKNLSVRKEYKFRSGAELRRRIAVVMRQIGAKGEGAVRTIVAIAKDENADSVVPLIEKYVDRSAEIWTDSGHGYSKLSMLNNHRTVTHSIEYATEDGVNNNQAESFFSRMRRAEYGVYNGMRRQYFAFYANEFAWRADMCKETLADKFEDAMKRIFKCNVSKAWCRYVQGHRLNIEYLD